VQSIMKIAVVAGMIVTLLLIPVVLSLGTFFLVPAALVLIPLLPILAVVAFLAIVSRVRFRQPTVARAQAQTPSPVVCSR